MFRDVCANYLLRRARASLPSVGQVPAEWAGHHPIRSPDPALRGSARRKNLIPQIVRSAFLILSENRKQHRNVFGRKYEKRNFFS